MPTLQLAAPPAPAPTRASRRVRRLFARITTQPQDQWQVLRAFVEWLSVCRFSVATLLIITAVLFGADQSAEALRVVCEDHHAGCVIPLLAAIAFWGHTSFYFPRILLRFEYPGAWPFDKGSIGRRTKDALRVHGPRVLGTASFFIVGIAIGTSSKPWFAPVYPQRLGFVSMAMGAVFAFALWYPRIPFDANTNAGYVALKRLPLPNRHPSPHEGGKRARGADGPGRLPVVVRRAPDGRRGRS